MSFASLEPIRRALIIAPHPDDETIGAFGLISILKARGTDIRVIVVTDGAASHRNSHSWPPARLRTARKAETIHAMSTAGVPTTSIRFLNYADGALDSLTAEQSERLSRKLCMSPMPDLVVGPSPCDDHPDHRAVAFATANAYSNKTNVICYTVWPSEDANIGHAKFNFSLPEPMRRRKRAAILSYATQNGLITDDPDGFSLTWRDVNRFCGPQECFEIPQ